MALVTRFETPAALRDLPADSVFYENWHEYISSRIQESTRGGGGMGEFYNASLVDVNVAGERHLTWMAFPRTVLMFNRDERQAAFASGEDPQPPPGLALWPQLLWQ